ncbi:MAG: signal peptidase II [Patescibacteria group bacterium]
MKKTSIILILCQIIDFAAYHLEAGEVNNRFIFGFYGNNWIAILTSMILLAAIVLWPTTRHMGTPVTLIFAGSLSNVLDRVIYGGVVDYMALWQVTHFNIADTLIIAGLFVLLTRIAENKKLPV